MGNSSKKNTVKTEKTASQIGPEGDLKPQEREELVIGVTADITRGRYSNLAIITHTQDEFKLDFILGFEKDIQLVSRVIVSPGHLKRLIEAMQINYDIYIKKYGEPKEPKPAST